MFQRINRKFNQKDSHNDENKEHCDFEILKSQKLVSFYKFFYGAN
jgi:hypothetical protein